MAKIIGLEAENFKRLQAVELEMSPQGLTVIGGRNRQGKTSVLDCIKSLVLGEKYTPTNALHEGAKKGSATIKLDNGMSISTTYTANGRTALRIEGSADLNGGPQTLLNQVFGAKALDVSKVLEASQKERTKILLEIIGVDLTPYEEKHTELYEKRADVGQLGTRAKGHYESLPFNEDVGTELVTASGLIKEQQAILQRNAEKKSIRDKAEQVQREITEAERQHFLKVERVKELKAMVETAEGEAETALHNVMKLKSAKEEAEKDASNVGDLEATDELEAKLAEIDETNAKIRENQERAKAEAEVKAHRTEYNSLTSQIEANQAAMKALLDDAEMPLNGLSVIDGNLTYNGQAWDCMSTAEQYMVASAIQAKLTPEAPVILVDRLEIMDEDSMADFGKWAEDNGYQIIGTRVSNGSECDYIIEDGMVADGKEVKKQDDKPSFDF